MKSKSSQSLQITHIASGDLWAGAEVQLFTLAKSLHSLDGITVHVILLNQGRLETSLRKLGIAVDVLDETQLNSFQILRGLVHILNVRKPDIVHTHRIKENILGGLAVILTGNIPSLRTVHGAPEHNPGWGNPYKQILFLLDWLLGRYLQRKIIAVSEELNSQLQKKYPSDKIVTIENTIDLDALEPYVKTLDVNRDARRTIKVGLVGRLVEVKRVDIYIQTAKYFRTNVNDISANFFIYGDGPLKKDLINLSHSLGVQDIVKFKGHFDAILPEIASLDVMLITSDHEGLPISLLEAMALGTPVIAHGVGGIPYVLGDSEYGYLVASQSPAAYAQCIKDCIVNVNKVMGVQARARKRIQERYSTLSSSCSYQALYAQIVDDSANAPEV